MKQNLILTASDLFEKQAEQNLIKFGNNMHTNYFRKYILNIQLKMFISLFLEEKTLAKSLFRVSMDSFYN